MYKGKDEMMIMENNNEISCNEIDEDDHTDKKRRMKEMFNSSPKQSNINLNNTWTHIVESGRISTM